jgi:hypothetical protein
MCIIILFIYINLFNVFSSLASIFFLFSSIFHLHHYRQDKKKKTEKILIFIDFIDCRHWFTFSNFNIIEESIKFCYRSVWVSDMPMFRRASIFSIIYCNKNPLITSFAVFNNSFRWFFFFFCNKFLYCLFISSSSWWKIEIIKKKLRL